MKHLAPTSSLLALLLALPFALPLALPAAVPIRWTCETSRVAEQPIDVRRGESLDLEARLTSYGRPIFPTGEAHLYWQTNGMGSAWWTAPAKIEHDRISAVWSPTNDVGAGVYVCYLGQPASNYRAAFRLRMLPGPGAIPNELPLPVRALDFSQVEVRSAPWPDEIAAATNGLASTEHVDDAVAAATNGLASTEYVDGEIAAATDGLASTEYVDGEVAAATGSLRRVDGAARPLPAYLHALDFDDSYPDAAQEYYELRAKSLELASAPRSSLLPPRSSLLPPRSFACSAVRDGGFLCRNFDFPFDDRAEFVVRMSASPARFASVGVAQVGTNLTERFVTSGRWSRFYKCLPGATVDGINENGVVAEINVVDGEPSWRTGGDIHPLAAVRWALDNGTSAGMVASNLAARIEFPQGWVQNFHYMVADGRETWIVENGAASNATGRVVMTNFPVIDRADGTGLERWNILDGGGSVTNAWYTLAYRRETNPPWVSDLAEVIARTNDIFDAWAAHPKEYFRGRTNGGQPWWQTVHSSVYDFAAKTLRVAVQETDDWYVFSLPLEESDPVFEGWRSGTNVVVIGAGAFSTKTNTVAVGVGSQATFTGAVAIGGTGAKANGAGATAVGQSAVAGAKKSAAFGYGAVVESGCEGAVQLGEGRNTTSNSLQFCGTVVVGADGKIPLASIAEGFVKYDESTWFGITRYDSITLGSRQGSGWFGPTYGNPSLVVGYNCTADQPYTVAQGYGTYAHGEWSHTEGEGTSTSTAALYAHAEGNNSEARAPGSHVEGESTKTYGDFSHAEGGWSCATGSWTHAEGWYTVAGADYSHAEGGETEAYATGAHAEGVRTQANAWGAHAEGYETIADGEFAHAEGVGCEAHAWYSHAEGGGSQTTWQGDYSHAEGYETVADSYYTHVDGVRAVSRNPGCYVWQGSVYPDDVTNYYDNGAGTYNINPVGGLRGFYVGTNNMENILAGLTNALWEAVRELQAAQAGGN